MITGFVINTGGAWSYTVDNSLAAVQALNTTSTALTDTFTFKSADGTTQQVSVSINGTNDAAVIGGGTSGSVTEAGGVANGTQPAGTSDTFSGTLTASDMDNTPNTFLAVSVPADNNGSYGKFSITSGGTWITNPQLSDAVDG